MSITPPLPSALQLIVASVNEPPPDWRDKRALMCNTVRRVIIECHNFCNRVCSFCLNSTLDRRSHKTMMSEEVFERILAELAAGGYRGSFMYGRYHEPLADEAIFARISRSRELLPHCHLLVNSNGDYLDRETVGRLAAAGLDELRVMIYTPNGYSFETSLALRMAETLLSRIGLAGTVVEHRRDEFLRIDVQTPNAALRMSVYAENYGYTGLGCDRGGAITGLSHIERDGPCHAPYFEIDIDFDGSVVACCNLLSEVPLHREGVVGNVAATSLTDIYFGKIASNFRSRAARNPAQPAVCRYCQYYWPNRLPSEERQRVC